MTVSRRQRDRGSSSLTMVLITPIFVVVAFMAFQAAMWAHARVEIRAVARNTAVLVARQDVAVDDARASAAEAIGQTKLVVNPDVTVDSDGVTVVVSIRGRAAGILRGTSVTISATEALPIERHQP